MYQKDNLLTVFYYKKVIDIKICRNVFNIFIKFKQKLFNIFRCRMCLNFKYIQFIYCN